MKNILKGIVLPLALEALLLLWVHHLWRNVDTPWLNAIFSVGIFNLFLGIGELLNNLGCSSPMQHYNSMNATGGSALFVMALDRLNDGTGEKYNRRNQLLSNISVRSMRLAIILLVAFAALFIAYIYYQNGYWGSLIE